MLTRAQIFALKTSMFVLRQVSISSCIAHFFGLPVYRNIKASYNYNNIPILLGSLKSLLFLDIGVNDM